MQLTLLTVISLVISISAVALTLWQTYLTRRALDYQAYLNLESVASTSMHGGIWVLNSLPDYTDYKTFEETETPEKQQEIQDVVFYLTFVAHLVSEGYVDKFQVWGRYFFGYRLCYQKLYPWYIEGLRAKRYGGEKIAYATFEGMCLLVAKNDKSEAFHKKLMKHQLKRLGRSVKKQLYPLHSSLSELLDIPEATAQARKDRPEPPKSQDHTSAVTPQDKKEPSEPAKGRSRPHKRKSQEPETAG